MRDPSQYSPALLQMLEASGELDRILDGRGLLFDNPPAPPVPQPQGLYIPPPDWEQERLDREARERAEREAALQAELAKLLESEAAEAPPKPTPPAPKRSRWGRTPA